VERSACWTKTSDIAIAAESWLAEFEEAAAERPLDDGRADEQKLFHSRQLLGAMRWRFPWTLQRPSNGRRRHENSEGAGSGAAPSGFAIDPDRAAPRKVMRAGTD